MKFKKLNEEARLPSKAHPSDAGFDLYAIEDDIIQSESMLLVPLGIASEIPDGYMAKICDRSSLGSKGIHCFAGVIDSGYRGEWKIALYNSTDTPFIIRQGDKIAQFVLLRTYHTFPEWANELLPSPRGTGGFGSTGR